MAYLKCLMPDRVSCSRPQWWMKTFIILSLSLSVFGCQRLEALWCCKFTMAQHDKRVRYEKGTEQVASIVQGSLPDILNKVKKFQHYPYENVSGIRVHIFNNRQRFSTFCGVSEQVSQGIRSSLSVCLSKPGIQQIASKNAHISLEMATEDALIRAISKLHLMQTTGYINYNVNVPSWFIEGLGESAVNQFRNQSTSMIMVESVQKALIDGVTFEPSYKGSIFGHREAEDFGMDLTMYRYQSGMFIDYLRETNDLAFKQVIGMVVERRNVGDVISYSYRSTLPSLWKDYIRSLDSKFATL